MCVKEHLRKYLGKDDDKWVQHVKEVCSDKTRKYSSDQRTFSKTIEKEAHQVEQSILRTRE